MIIQCENVLRDDQLANIIIQLRALVLYRLSKHFGTDKSKTSEHIQEFTSTLDILHAFVSANDHVHFLTTLGKVIGPQKKNPTARLIYHTRDESLEETDVWRELISKMWARILLHARAMVRDAQINAN